jgi:hypothetical protein
MNGTTDDDFVIVYENSSGTDTTTVAQGCHGRHRDRARLSRNIHGQVDILEHFERHIDEVAGLELYQRDR